MSRIKDVKARQLYDSRARPTLEVEVETDDGKFRAIVPTVDPPSSGNTSVSPHDAHHLLDNDAAKFDGRGVSAAINNVNNELAVAVIGMDPTDQEGIDQALNDVDGSDDRRKRRMGANAILGVSMAVARAGAAKKAIPLYVHINNLAGNPTYILPVPCFNVINGGVHAGNGLPMQEFTVMPTGAESFSEAMRIGVEVYQALRRLLEEKYGRASVAVEDEGGFAPSIDDPEKALQLIKTAVHNSGYEEQVTIGIDVAASRFYNDKNKSYNFDFKADVDTGTKTTATKTANDLLRLYKLFAANYGVVSIEDPFHHEDFGAFEGMTAELGELIQIVGDDLLATNIDRIEHAIETSACNALLLKLDQIGTVTEAIEANNTCRNSGFGVMVSHRPGDTEDPFIAALCVGLGTGQIKAGAPARSEHVAKYNELLRIEEDLGERAAFAGDYWRDPWMLQPPSASKY